ncbi:MAG: deoxyguanosinetriphosphate triphosphohydrolase [Coriobacteriia bacterium]|nr:deoxyguanosinetriphosphate triphosphohydrolase [Coriobacteriia bacterium]
MGEVQRNKSPHTDEAHRLTLCAREEREEREVTQLSPYAALAVSTKGRVRARPLDDYRTEFQRDRDRIFHCKSFRRLRHKTQVFLDPEGDHYRTRLTHTLEVAQISRAIAQTLRLNEDLTEAIALGHDLGHTPFGHTGETALNEALAEIAEGYDDAPLEFHHAAQSLRVVEVLEHEGRGLNLCWETRDGIYGHSGAYYPQTLEGQVVRIADRIAYLNHDIDDAIAAEILHPEDIPATFIEILGETSPQRITTVVQDLTAQSCGQRQIMMTTTVRDALDGLRRFMFANVYDSYVAKSGEVQAKRVVKELFYYYLQHEDELPIEYFEWADGKRVQAVIDYLSGMTDRFARREYERIFVPAPFSNSTERAPRA